jgi:hypothetical protein
MVRRKKFLRAALLCFGVALALPLVVLAQLSTKANKNLETMTFSAGALNTTPAGGASTVDQGAAGLDPWLFELDQTGTANNVDAVCTGPAADGAAVSGNPVRIGIRDTAGNTQDLLGATDGVIALGTGTAPLVNTANAAIFPRDSSGSARPLMVHQFLFDGSTLDPMPGDSANGTDVDPTRAAPAATVDTSFTAQAADFTIEAATANLRLMGYTIRESAGSAAVATVVLRHDADGTCDGTAVVDFIELAANESLRVNHGPRGLAIASGLCADVIAGTVDFGAFFRTE